MRDYDREEELRNEDRYADYLQRKEMEEEEESCEDDREDERQAINKEKKG